MDSRDGLRLRELHSMADELALMDPGIQLFVTQVFDHLHRLTGRVDDLESEVADLRDRVFLDGDHRRRLETMIDAQSSELREAQASVERVRAVVDLARWSGHRTGEVRVPVVQVDEIERALAAQP